MNEQDCYLETCKLSNLKCKDCEVFQKREAIKQKKLPFFTFLDEQEYPYPMDIVNIYLKSINEVSTFNLVMEYTIYYQEYILPKVQKMMEAINSFTKTFNQSTQPPKKTKGKKNGR